MDLIKTIWQISPQFFSLCGLVVFIIVSIYYIKIIREASSIENKILELKNENKDMELTIHKQTAGFLNQSQLDTRVKKAKEGTQDEIDILETKRRFKLEKLPLIGFLKK